MNTINKIARRIKRECYCKVILPHKGRTDILVSGVPVHKNIGDHAILLAEKEFLSAFGKVEQISRDDCLRKELMIPQKTLIVLHGGGNMGDLWPIEEKARRTFIDRFPVNNKILFPQTIFYEDKGQEQASISYYKHDNLILVARDDYSYVKMQELYGNNVIEAPDIVLSVPKSFFGIRESVRSGVLLCFRQDKEKKLASDDQQHFESVLDYFTYTDMISDIPVTENNCMKVVSDKMNEFASAELVITDRLHGMIFSAVTETPCIVLPNNHYKVKGQYKWLRNLPYIYFADTVEDAVSNIDRIRAVKDRHYEPLTECFQTLTDAVKKII